MLHIVPSVPPAFNGLGDYCYQLWKHWPAPRPEWHVATAQLPSGAQEAWPEAAIHAFETSRDGLLQVLTESKAETVVLHYVGYGYAQRGAPGWLPEALKLWKEKSGGKLVVMFHELYATGPPWKSEFWFCLAQRKVASGLARLADQWVTSCPRYVRVLIEILGADRAKGEMIPIGSNIEPIEEPDWERPWPPANHKQINVAVFGMPLTRLRALRTHKNLLSSLLTTGLVAEVMLIGKSDQDGSVHRETVEVIQSIGHASSFVSKSDLPVESISRQLLGCHIGLVQNPYEILHKSTAFSAFATHGVLSIIPARGNPPAGNFVCNDDSRPEIALAELSAAFVNQGGQGLALRSSSTTLRFADVCVGEQT